MCVCSLGWSVHPLPPPLQKDSHTQYLERELESLRVVLEIRNTQLHQQDSKLMQLDKLVRTHTHTR